MTIEVVRKYPRSTAEMLAAIVDAADPEWTREGLADALSAHRRGLDDAQADAVAGHLLVAFPRQPPDRRDAIAGRIVELAMPPLRPRPAPRELWDGLPRYTDYSALAAAYDMTVSELDWLADRGTWLRSRTGPLQHYRVTPIPKRRGARVLEIPKPRLRETQRRILRRVLDRLPPHPAAQGFVAGTSPATFSSPHAGRPVVIRIDLRRCFETITVARVRAVFAAVGYPPAVARALADLCTTTTPAERLVGVDPVHAAILRSRHLPQGAPTSPALANLVMRTLDRRITGYAHRHGLVYTRYGDDMALSGTIDDPSAVVWVVGQIVADEGFTVHGDKTRIMYAHQQQRLTGLVINDRPRVCRSEYDDLRALLHNAIRTGARAQNRDDVGDFEAHVRGRIAWVGATSTARRQKLLEMASRVDWSSD